ncbi:UNVERIFIED_CONTAM: TIGR01906 family membrane protein [Streptococcus canis]|uniref:TIGR01906 family membrane protein n=1 Tax=Streptococcus canis TaxID=1329 RepID=UPI0013DA2FCE|nr:TIGR01906 family membrane protein [Streptococcus canis]QKG75468.1 TIGR01906 family membrane protein [Streptococcus canis]
MVENIKLFCSWLWVLALSVLITIYAAWLLYPVEIDYLHLEQVVLMTKSSILYNYNGLLHYLTNPFVTRLELASFHSSEDGLKHFADVKWLFHLTQVIFLGLLYPTVKTFTQMIKTNSFWLIQKPLMMAALFPLIIGLTASFIGFDHFFILFHKMLFVGDSSWLFDPLQDPIIWLLPEVFFLHCFLFFMIVYEIILWSLVGLARRQRLNVE